MVWRMTAYVTIYRSLLHFCGGMDGNRKGKRSTVIPRETGKALSVCGIFQKQGGKVNISDLFAEKIAVELWVPLY